MPHLSAILKTKLFLPQPTSDFVARKSLESKFENLHSIPLMLVSASTGFGKSTLIANFLSNLNEDYAWLSLSEKENEIQQFIKYFITAVQGRVEHFGKEVLELAFALEPPPIDVLAELLVNDMAELNRHLYLAIDDYHLIRNIAVHQFIAKLFEYPQPFFRLIIITRRDPELPLPEWISKNKLVEIRSSDLKFNRKEIAEFYEKAIAYLPYEDILLKLEEATDGWVSGLRMLTLSTNNNEKFQEYFLNFRYKNSRVINKLIDGILKNQPEQIRDILLRLSLLKEFNVDLFAELCLSENEKENKELRFDDFTSAIIKSNMFIIALDDKHKWFRFHHMFTDQLFEVFKEEYDEKTIQKLVGKAADWFRKSEQPDDAIEYYLKAKHVRQALDVFIEYRLKLISETRFQRLETIFNLFPKDIADKNGILLVTKGWLLLQKDNIPTMARHIEPLESLLLHEAHPKELLNLLVGELHTMKAYNRYLADVDMPACYDHSKQAIELLKDNNPYATGIAWIFYGASLQILGEATKARNDIYREFQKSTNPIIRGQLLFSIAFLEWFECDLAAMLKAGDHLLDIGLETGVKFLISNGSVFVGMAHFCQNNNEKALSHLIKAHELSRYTYMRMSVVSGMALVDVYTQMDKKEEVENTYNSYEKLALKQGGKLFTRITKSASADLAWRYQKNKSGLKWAKENDYKDFLPLANLYSPELVQARILILDEEPESHRLAQDIINNTIPYFEDRKDLNVLLKAFVIQALIHYKASEKDKAFETLKKAINLSSIGSYFRPYLDLGESMRQLLLEYKKSVGKSTHIDDILRHYNSETIEKPLLSIREKEILAVSENLTNIEVGEKLFIAEKTVKVHLNNINRKLKANSKINAINKAKELGLI